jgi:hypothetical protein
VSSLGPVVGYPAWDSFRGFPHSPPTKAGVVPIDQDVFFRIVSTLEDIAGSDPVKGTYFSVFHFRKDKSRLMRSSYCLCMCQCVPLSTFELLRWARH